MPAIQKITTFLWFDNNAEEAIQFYVSVFKNSKLISLIRHGEAGPGPKGTVLGATFQLAGQQFFALNGGPKFKFTEAISLFVSCDTQEEIDHLWEKLSAGGWKDRCGWLKDKFGLLANRPRWLVGNVAGPGLRQSRSRHASHDANGQARHPALAAGL